MAKLDNSSTVAFQSFPREASHRQYGLTTGNFSNGTENGYYRSPRSSPTSYLKKDNDIDNVHRQSPPVSSVQNKTSASARWVAPQFLHDITDRNELIFRRVRGILNKLTPERFDKLCYDLTSVGINNKTILKGIIILIFEKAIDEQKYCKLYAQLCQRLSHEVPNFDDSATNTTTFLRLLLSKCQEEFETRSKASSAFDKKEDVLSPTEQEAKQVAKRKMLGNIKFIGELGKLDLLQEAILHKCIQQLLAKKKRVLLSDMAEDIECLCQIMATIGKQLDTLKAKNIMDQYFDRIYTLCHSEELPARIRFFLQDILELRAKKWTPRRIQRDNGPRSVTQMRWEMMGPMMPPPFPFFPTGMRPPAGNVPFDINGGGGMPWFNDPMFSGGVMPPSLGSKKLTDYVDDSKDIFGKPVHKAPAPKKQNNYARPQAKPDLFEPHYMKSKGSTSKVSQNNTLANGRHSSNNCASVGDEKESTKPTGVNKGNPWNIDPFVPHYNKPTVFPVNEEALKTSEAAISPRVEMKSLPQNSRSNGTTQYNKTYKKDGEISLRPTSFLNKKDEKPKTTFTKAEELPAKMQQFTNLTINDKTTSKTKKTGLTKNDIEKKIIEMMKQYSEDNSIDKVCNEIQSLATNLKYSKMVAKQLLYYAASQNETDWSILANICVECGKKSVISNETFVNALVATFDDTKIIEETSGKDFVSVFSAAFIYNDLISLPNFVEHFQDGNHYPIALLCFAELYKDHGKEWLEKAYKDANIDLKLTFPVDFRCDNELLNIVEEKNLAFLFPHLCLKDELLKLMKNGSNEELLLSWIKKHVEGKVDEKLLIHMIVTCAVTIATLDTLTNSDHAQKPEKEFQEKEKESLDQLKLILKEYLHLNSTMQLETIYALQIFCYEKVFPKEMLLRLFIIFYNLEIIEEDVFLKWKEDINDTYPGKGKSLFQVNNWLQWLETADEEDEDGEDDEEN